MKLLTAKKGEPHFTSTHFRAMLEAVCGTGSYRTNLYEMLEAEMAANNIIKIRSGMLIHHGGLFLVEPGTYDEVSYMNGTQGMKRIDLVVARYTKNEETGIENSEWVVIQGVPAESNPVAPEYIVGNMQEGDLIDDCPVFEIHFDGINVTEVKKLLKIEPSIDRVCKNISNPNLLINGDFQVWQRGESFEFNGLNKICYSADRWGIYNLSEQTIKIKKLDKGLQLESSDNSTNLHQSIETPLEVGEYYTLSAKINGVIQTLGIVGGTPVENEHFKYYQYDNTYCVYDNVQIKPNGVTTIEWVKLEKGSIATPITPRLYAEELILCQRFYQCGIYALHRYYNFGNNHFIYVGELKTHMRTLPTANCFYAKFVDGEGVGRPAQIYEITYSDRDTPYTNDGFWFEARTHFLGYEPQQGSAVMESGIAFDAEIY